MEKSVPNSTLSGRHNALPRIPTIQINIVAKETYEVFILFYFIFETETPVTQVGFKLAKQLGLTMNSDHLRSTFQMLG